MYRDKCPNCDNMGVGSTLEPSYRKISSCWDEKDTHMVFLRTWFCFNCDWEDSIKEKCVFSLESVRDIEDSELSERSGLKVGGRDV